ncbi:hypothetical protein [Flavobacterium sharifuzzamanii]|uniref:hypothetical protein n=1 Tax=Flavobacterium sharifuzzamanii TaxID=2211133 RepID=UPI000DAB9EEB|nr:hypothetical protein [Flavobacterium sharifuzzamanii]KAF2078721.1 hypothetical protein DMA14_19705 [Flavobacterium sharifuzzamanii]
MKLFLNTNNGLLPVKIKKEKTLSGKIYWPFLEVCAGENIESNNLHQAFNSDFIGSSHFLSGEGFTFNKNSLILTNIFLHVPEENIKNTSIIDKCLQSISITGLLSLSQQQKFSSYSLANYRYLDCNRNLLIAIDSDDLKTDEILRVKIHDRIDLLFKNKIHCGFILYDPIRSLVRFTNDFEKGDENYNYIFLANDLSDYLNSITESNWYKLEQKNPELKNRLEKICENLKDKDHSLEPVFALDNQCKNILNDYY